MIAFEYTDYQEYHYIFRCYKSSLHDSWDIVVDCLTTGQTFARISDDFMSVVSSFDLISDEAKHYCIKYLNNLAFI